MISHRTEFSRSDLLQIVGSPVLVAGAVAALLHLGAWTGVLPPPRPTLDTDRTILIHQADAARSSPPVEMVLIGDSSCLMDVAAAHLGASLGRPVINLGTLSYLDPAAYGLLLGQLTRRHPPRAVVLLMHPDALRRVGSEPHPLAILNNYLAGRDDSRTESASGAFAAFAGVDIASGRLLARIVPTPLRGAYGAYYGFSRGLEDFMNRNSGSAVDPGTEPFPARSEYRLAPTLAKASESFRAAIPASTRLVVGMTPVPAGIAPREFSTQRNGLLQQWAGWLKADVVLTNLPAVLPDNEFARVTHLKPGSVTNYTERLAAVLRSHFP